jgi:hypothetical protein
VPGRPGHRPSWVYGSAGAPPGGVADRRRRAPPVRRIEARHHARIVRRRQERVGRPGPQVDEVRRRRDRHDRPRGGVRRGLARAEQRHHAAPARAERADPLEVDLAGPRACERVGRDRVERVVVERAAGVEAAVRVDRRVPVERPHVVRTDRRRRGSAAGRRSVLAVVVRGVDVGVAAVAHAGPLLVDLLAGPVDARVRLGLDDERRLRRRPRAGTADTRHRRPDGRRG